MQTVTRESVLQMYETSSLKEVEEKDADLSNYKWPESIRLKTKGAAHKHCALSDKVVFHGQGYMLTIMKPWHMYTGTE